MSARTINTGAGSNHNTLLSVDALSGTVQLRGALTGTGPASRQTAPVISGVVYNGVRAGTHVNTAEAHAGATGVVRPLRTSIPSRAPADIRMADNGPMLDESLILGTVYHDRNGNGMREQGESGIPGVRLATVEGHLIETDQYGRFHLKGISGTTTSAPHGRNFILKVDPSTLSGDAVFTTDNPLLRRVTPGLPVRFDFGVSLNDVDSAPFETGPRVDMEVSDAVFVEGKAEIRDQYRPALERMAQMIQQKGIGRVVLSKTVDRALAARRVIVLAEEVRQRLGYEIEVIVDAGDTGVD
ncbi:MAG: hypothetical protein LBL59_10240 [Xanthomonadaceae bacterium]|nr:hypothetical protein [Xanthomonadaceae bacterium]